MTRHAAILNIGNELLQGHVVNSNAATIARLLRENGWIVQTALCIADGPQALANHLPNLMQQHALIVCTGGLGPTPDDTTRYDVAALLGLEMERHAVLQTHVEEWFAARGRPCRDTNEPQYWLPQGAQILHNRLGTAAGFKLSTPDCTMVFLPGVPSEMETILREEFLPTLHDAQDLWHSRELVTWDLGEDLQTQLLAEIAIPAPLSFASLPGPDGLLLRLSARGPQDSDLETALDQCWAQILLALQPHADKIVSLEGQKLPEATHTLLRQHQHTLALAESCTGGRISALLTRVPGSSATLLGGIVAYDNSVKTQILGVAADLIQEHGAVSEQVARAMAQGAARVCHSDWALSTTGIAGPDGGTATKPLGTVWLGVAHGPHTWAKLCPLRGNRDQIQSRAATVALDFLRRCVAGLEENKKLSLDHAI